MSRAPLALAVLTFALALACGGGDEAEVETTEAAPPPAPRPPEAMEPLKSGCDPLENSIVNQGRTVEGTLCPNVRIPAEVRKELDGAKIFVGMTVRRAKDGAVFDAEPQVVRLSDRGDPIKLRADSGEGVIQAQVTIWARKSPCDPQADEARPGCKSFGVLLEEPIWGQTEGEWIDLEPVNWEIRDFGGGEKAIASVKEAIGSERTIIDGLSSAGSHPGIEIHYQAAFDAPIAEEVAATLRQRHKKVVAAQDDTQKERFLVIVGK